MRASIVYASGGEGVVIPASMGAPASNQLQGMVLEQLGELACRICYDSLGSGRSSEALHKHILQVINLSVYEHINFTVQFPATMNQGSFIINLINRKGIWLEVSDGWLEVTINLRALLEWDKYTTPTNMTFDGYKIRNTLYCWGNTLCPQLIKAAIDNVYSNSRLKTSNLTPDQAFVSMWLYGSRGFSLEQVRHRMAISQRSTRYVDESESDYVQHPLTTQYLNDVSIDKDQRSYLQEVINRSVSADKWTYREAVNQLEKYNIKKGLNTTDARKQARGAGRGYLGNALATEMIFTAPISAWKNVLIQQRLSRFADAEIRSVYEDVLVALQDCDRYRDYFSTLSMTPSPDGLGKVLDQ